MSFAISCPTLRLSRRTALPSCRSLLALVLAVLLCERAHSQHLLYRITGTQPGERYGAFVEVLGDTNADGTSDLLAWGGGLLSLSGSDGTELLNFGQAFSAAAIGDVDRDGNGDLVETTWATGTTVRSGKDGHALFSLVGGENPCNCQFGTCNYQFGWAVGLAGDVNRDGYPDIIVGAPSRDWYAYVELFSGLDGSKLALFKFCDNSLNPTGFGESVGNVGDLDLDGHCDFAMATPFGDIDDDFFCDGKLEVRSGRTGQLLYSTFEDRYALGCPETGRRLGALGDLNGDGYVDFWYFSLCGSKIISGADDTTMHDSIALDAVSATGIGDLDLDGADDFALCVDSGKVSAYSGRSGGLLFELTGFSRRTGGQLRVAGGADLNGDGVGDLVVGDPGFDLDPNTKDSGVIEVYSLCAPAGWSNYGSGFPGTLGIPTLDLGANPSLGATVQLRIGNSLGLDTIGLLFVGPEPADVPSSWGGHLLVDALFPPQLVLIQAADQQIDLKIADQPSLCGLHLYWQTLELDGGATHNVSFTPGLDMRIGD